MLWVQVQVKCLRWSRVGLAQPSYHHAQTKGLAHSRSTICLKIPVFTLYSLNRMMMVLHLPIHRTFMAFTVIYLLN